LSAVREAIDGFREVDTVPLGINPGDADSHLRFRSSLDLPFDLLVDDELAVARAYGALKLDPERPGEFLAAIDRTVVIVGKDGRVIFRRKGAPPSEELLDAILTADDDPG
jgi:thioredoxin-dependent peroxiredoxin